MIKKSLTDAEMQTGRARPRFDAELPDGPTPETAGYRISGAGSRQQGGRMQIVGAVSRKNNEMLM